jgi:hypothetical protein
MTHATDTILVEAIRPMLSPFPGMDPYLEDPDIWEDFHSSLAAEVRDQITPHLLPRYYAALTPRITYEEVLVEQTRLVKPDVSVLKLGEEPLGGRGVAIAPAPVEGTVLLEVPVKEQSIEIRDVETRRLVTAIEILSPVNKRPGHEAFEAYRRKRRDLLRTDVHILEIDLLRAGTRPPLATALPAASYFIFLSRGNRRPRVEIWPLRIREEIPVVPVPLSPPDPDVPLDLGKAIRWLRRAD